MKSGKQHFVGVMQRLAKKRSASRSRNPLQVGNVLTKKAPMGAAPVGNSNIDKPEGQGLTIQPTKGQLGLNPKQQGAKKS